MVAVINFTILHTEQLYQLQSEDRLVSIGEVGVHGHDDTVAHDGQDDAVLERSAVDKPLHQPSKVCNQLKSNLIK